MDFESAMQTFAEAWAAANAVIKPELPADLSQNLRQDYQQRSKTPPTRRQSPARTEPCTPRSRTPTRTPAEDAEVNAKKETFNNLLSKSLSAKSLPVHCIVECVPSLEEGCWKRRPTIETDSYVIIPAATAFQELVTAALVRLGYPLDVTSSARGSVVINNWKPLPFDKISEGPMATVGDILGELTTVATLKIQVLRPRPSAMQEIKDKLLRLFLAQSRGLLVSTGCPLDEITLAQLCRGHSHLPGPHNFQDIPEEIKRKFEQWWNMQVSPRPTPFSPRHPPSPMAKLERSPSINQLSDHVHPALQTVQSQYPTQKTRMRTSFDPELELPKLQRWFSENQHPSRQQIQMYVRELNNLESRRGRKPLDVNNVVYWFKNARAAQKRQELRNIGGLSCHLSMNGFHSRSHSPTNGSLQNDSFLGDQRQLKSPVHSTHSPTRGYSISAMSDNTSNAGSDLDDDSTENQIDRADSPEGPISLITTKKDENPKEEAEESPKPPDIIKDSEIKQEPSDLSKSSPRLSPTKTSDSESNNNNTDQNGANDNNQSDDDAESEVTEIRHDSTEGNDQSHLGSHHFSPGNPHSHHNLDRLPFPMVPNPMFRHGIMYMSHYIPGLAGVGHGPADPAGASGLNLSSLSGADERRKRNRTFIDPVSEVPVLEQWFSMNTHPSHNLILKYTEELNRMPYRQKFPRLESKNVQFWFKNRRAKCKRLKMSLYEPGSPSNLTHYHGTERKLS